MSSIRGLMLFYSTIALVSGCYTMKVGQNASLSNSMYLGAAWSMRDAYKNPPPPPQVAPPVKATPFEFGFTADYRKFLNPRAYFGVTSTYLSWYADNSDLGGTEMYFQRIRYTALEEVVLKRLPTLGLSLGYLFGDRPGLRAMVQYSVSFVWYELSVNTYQLEYDCGPIPGCNTIVGDTLINSKEIARGAGVRQAMRIGGEYIHGLAWIEFDGKTQMTGGLGIELSDVYFKE